MKISEYTKNKLDSGLSPLIEKAKNTEEFKNYGRKYLRNKLRKEEWVKFLDKEYKMQDGRECGTGRIKWYIIEKDETGEIKGWANTIPYAFLPFKAIEDFIFSIDIADKLTDLYNHNLPKKEETK